MTPGDCFRAAAEMALAERRGLDANKTVWSNNPILTPDLEYIDDWERRAEEGESIAKALLARAAEEDQRESKQGTAENAGTVTTLHAEVASADSHPTPEAAALADALDYMLTGPWTFAHESVASFLPLVDEDVELIKQAIAALRGKGKP